MVKGFRLPEGAGAVEKFVDFSGGVVFVGTGGVDYGVSTTSAVTQFNVGGGLMFLF